MNNLRRFPVLQLLQCPAKVFESRIVESLDIATRCCYCHRHRNAVHDTLKVVFVTGTAIHGKLSSDAVPSTFGRAIIHRVAAQKKRTANPIWEAEGNFHLERLALLQHR